MRKKVLLFLFMANMLLLCLAWIMGIYAFPRLPSKIPLWISFFGQPVMLINKSSLFFIYPLAQTGFFLVFLRLSKVKQGGKKRPRKSFLNLSEDKFPLCTQLKKEFVFLVLIFFNLIFIHLQRSIILLAHRIEKGISGYYFYSLFGIILILIPYYRLRKKLLIKK